MARNSKRKQFYLNFEETRKRLLASQDDSFTFTNTRNNLITITRDELISFVQCVTDDVNAKYYLARKGFPIYWFVSKNGNILSLSGRTPKFVAPSLCGHEDGMREQYEISEMKNGKTGKFNGIAIDPATVVGLCFDAEATTEAKKMLDTHGLLAIKRSFGTKAVDIHHKEGYCRYASPPEMRSYNCRLDKIMFATVEEHNIFTNAWKAKEEKTMLAQMKTLASLEHSSITAYSSYTGGKGEMCDKLLKKHVRTVLQKTDLCLLKFGAPYLLYDNGNEIIPGSDMPQELYEEYWNAYKKYLEVTGDFSTPYFIGIDREKRIFGALKSA